MACITFILSTILLILKHKSYYVIFYLGGGFTLKRVTLKDIAKEAGVSVSMVSYVLNKRGRITNEKHKKILSIANKYNYVPDANARGLVTGVTNNVGFVIHRDAKKAFSQPFVMKILTELSKNLSEYSGWLSLCMGNDMSVETMRNYLGNAKLDGIIFLYAQNTDETAETLSARNTPCIFVNSEIQNPNVANISCDDYLGVSMALDYLAERGHEEILFMSAKREDQDKYDIRYRAYSDGIKRHGFSYSKVLRGNYKRKDSHRAIKRYFQESNERPTAVICANDEMAGGVLSALDEMKIKVPEEISVFGFDDANIDFNEDVGLSSVRQPIEKMAESCVKYIYDAILKNDSSGMVMHVEPQLIIRNSVSSKR